MLRTLFILLCILPAHVRAETTISAKTVYESFSSNVKVGGGFLIGIQLNSIDELRSLHVYLPDGAKGSLCVELASIDGKYKAKFKHQIKKSLSGPINVKFESKYRDIMNDYSDKEIAISASLRDSCDSNSISKRLISSWGGNVTDELILLIRSSARKDVAYIINKEKRIAKSKCRKFRKSYNVSYDKYCILKGADLEDIEEIEIIRRNLQPIESEQIKIN